MFFSIILVLFSIDVIFHTNLVLFSEDVTVISEQSRDIQSGSSTESISSPAGDLQNAHAVVTNMHAGSNMLFDLVSNISNWFMDTFFGSGVPEAPKAEVPVVEVPVVEVPVVEVPMADVSVIDVSVTEVSGVLEYPENKIPLQTYKKDVLVNSSNLSMFDLSFLYEDIDYLCIFEQNVSHPKNSLREATIDLHNYLDLLYYENEKFPLNIPLQPELKCQMVHIPTDNTKTRQRYPILVMNVFQNVDLVMYTEFTKSLEASLRFIYASSFINISAFVGPKPLVDHFNDMNVYRASYILSLLHAFDDLSFPGSNADLRKAVTTVVNNIDGLSETARKDYIDTAMRILLKEQSNIIRASYGDGSLYRLRLDFCDTSVHPSQTIASTQWTQKGNRITCIDSTFFSILNK